MKRGFLVDEKSRRKDDTGLLRDPRSRDGWNSWGTNRLGTAPGSWSIPTSVQDGSAGDSSRDNEKVNHLESASISGPAQRASASHALRPSQLRPVHEQQVQEDDQSTTTTAPVSSIADMNLSSDLSDRPRIFEGMTEFLPHKTVGVPRAALAAWYGQKPRCHQVTKESYISWNDGGMSHNQRFSSLFVCPLTGEIFATGEYGSRDKYEIRYQDSETGRDIGRQQQEDSDTVPDDAVRVIWYKQKTLAEHGAAARAYDCFSFRRNSTTNGCLGRSMPYALEDRPPLPLLSPDVEERVRKRTEQAQSRMEVEQAVELAILRKEKEQHEIEQDRQRERHEYRTARMTSQLNDVAISKEDVANSKRMRDSSIGDEGTGIAANEEDY